MSNDESAPDLHLQGFTCNDRAAFLPELGIAIDHAGGWVLERHAVSAVVTEMHLELQIIALPDVYATLLECGVELTRDSHRAITERCTCGLHQRPSLGLPNILSVRLEMHFLPEPPQPLDLTRLLLLGAATA